MSVFSFVSKREGDKKAEEETMMRKNMFPLFLRERYKEKFFSAE
jgi:hypothetical protein